MGFIDEDLIAGAIEYKRTKKTNKWIKWGALAACLCAVIMIGILAPLDSGNTFTLKAYAMDVIEDGTVSFVEADLITQSNNWGGYFDGEYFYLNVGLGYDGKNIESVELVIENGIFASQSITEHSQEQNVPKVYVGADNQLVMYGTNFTPVGNSIVLDTPASADNLIFIAIPANNETDIPKDINITATATFLDGSKKVIETSLDFTGIGVYVWKLDDETIKDFENLKKNGKELLNPVN